MSQEISQSIRSAAKKDYSEFENKISDTLNTKMKERLSGFMGHLEKNTFKSTEE